MTTVPAPRLLFVHAHPDDETIGCGATMARYAAAGAEVTLVTCTLGEEGEIVVDDLAHLAADREDRLGEHRIGELAAACAALGVRDHRFLGGAGRWRDSGMMDTPTNDNPGCFWRADPAETVPELVRIIREVRPDAAITYDDNGGYGHPDHIQAHRVTVAALISAADSGFHPETGEPWSTPRLYYTALPRSIMVAGIAALRAAGQNPWNLPDGDDVDLPMLTPDELVTTAVAAPEFVDAKLAALRAHRSQIRPDGPIFAVFDAIGPQALGTEYYSRIQGPPTGTGPGWDAELV
jgi:N-acetyl-1-D-myo-inositol-2-amino-2-deoxy-alpha-D-glucopyranoside deacetylase